LSDSTSIPICHPKRAKRNKVFRGLSGWGKSYVDWYFGFKLHLIINDKGESILDFRFWIGRGINLLIGFPSTTGSPFHYLLLFLPNLKSKIQNLKLDDRVPVPTLTQNLWGDLFGVIFRKNCGKNYGHSIWDFGF